MSPAQRTAEWYVLVYGKALIGRKIFTPENGDYPGGVATVRRLGDDPNAPDIVLIVHLPGYELNEIGVFNYELISFAHMTPDEARRHFVGLLHIYRKDTEEWEKKLEALPKQDRFLVCYGGTVEGFPPHPRHPRHTHTWELPHPHLVNEAKKQGQVWVGNHGWMNKREWDDLLLLVNEEEKAKEDE